MGGRGSKKTQPLPRTRNTPKSGNSRAEPKLGDIFPIEALQIQSEKQAEAILRKMAQELADPLGGILRSLLVLIDEERQKVLKLEVAGRAVLREMPNVSGHFGLDNALGELQKLVKKDA